MNSTEPRTRLRALLSGSNCASPASVYDPLSARIAESIGFEVGLLSGSVVSATTLAAPDLQLHTLTEYAEQIRRIMRACRLSLLVDADNGYGNALNVMRTVQELEHAGVSAIGIEDTVLPVAFGQSPDSLRLVPIEEAVGKIRAAIAARSDPALVIAARTPALQVEGLDGLVARARAYAEAGADAIWTTSLDNLDQLDRLRLSAAGPPALANEGTRPLGGTARSDARGGHTSVPLPIIVGTKHGNSTNDELAGKGVRIALQGHLPLAAAVKALREAYRHLYNGGSPEELKRNVASPAEMDELVRRQAYEGAFRDFLSER